MLNPSLRQQSFVFEGIDADRLMWYVGVVV